MFIANMKVYINLLLVKVLFLYSFATVLICFYNDSGFLTLVLLCYLCSWLIDLDADYKKTAIPKIYITN